MTAGPAAPLGYYLGDDAYALEAAADRLARRVAGENAPRLERWRATGATTSVALIGERLATASMFGGGTIAIVSDPGPLIGSKAARTELFAIFDIVAPGNALAILDPVERFPKDGRPTGHQAELKAAIEAAGGEFRACKAPTEGRMAHWLEELARERGVRLGRDAARVLAERVGAFVREGDVDRRRQGQLAAAELDKLALYRLDGEVSADDVRALVPEAVPGSTWALLDAIGFRRTNEAARQLERVVGVTPPPVVLAQLHRRLRELIEVADLARGGLTDRQMADALKIHRFRAETLAKQAAHWTVPELERALDGVLDLDAAVKGGGGGQARETAGWLAFSVWLADRVAPGRG